MEPTTCYTLQRNTANVLRKFVFENVKTVNIVDDVIINDFILKKYKVLGRGDIPLCSLHAEPNDCFFYRWSF